ncbi:hypothetical protein DL95DRAFT_450920 [Leptodontidium sp. 2 PMI_412]|nr:hypothetical protein DL95DRAFT_450920 [Leptodontidium sp. 2 PMI_412]
MAEIEFLKPELPELPDAPGFHQHFGKPGAEVGFIFLYDYLFSIKPPSQPRITRKNLVAAYKQISAIHARTQRKPGIREFDEIAYSLEANIPDSCGISFRYINNKPITSIGEILSQHAIEEHTNKLLNFLSRKGSAPKHVILVGHGYGGLICEQTFTRLEAASASSGEDRATKQLQGILLLNTPHFQAGLAQWTLLTAKELNLKSAKSRQRQNWAGCLKDFDMISKMQAKFAASFKASESGVRLACCFAKLSDPVTGLRLSPEFSCLPHVEPIEIHDSSHFCIDTTHEDFKYIIEKLAIWAEEIRKKKKPVGDPLPLKSLAGSSRANDPAWKWDPKSLDYYLTTSWKGKAQAPSASVALGDILKETYEPHSPITKRDDVVSLLKGQLVDFGPSYIIKSDVVKWERLLSSGMVDASYKVIVREEWSKNRSIEYVKAALQGKVVREHLKGIKQKFYVITGLIRGAKTPDSNSNEWSEPLGFQCRIVSVKQQPSEKATDFTRLVIEQYEARMWSESKGELPPIATGEIRPEIAVVESSRSQLETEERSKEPRDVSPKPRPQRVRSKGVRNVWDIANNATEVISTMRKLAVEQRAGLV